MMRGILQRTLTILPRSDHIPERDRAGLQDSLLLISRRNLIRDMNTSICVGRFEVEMIEEIVAFSIFSFKQIFFVVKYRLEPLAPMPRQEIRASYEYLNTRHRKLQYSQDR